MELLCAADVIASRRTAVMESGTTKERSSDAECTWGSDTHRSLRWSQPKRSKKCVAMSVEFFIRASPAAAAKLMIRSAGRCRLLVLLLDRGCAANTIRHGKPLPCLLLRYYTPPRTSYQQQDLLTSPHTNSIH